MYLVSSAFTSSPVSLVATTKVSAFSLTVCTLYNRTKRNMLTSVDGWHIKIFCAAENFVNSEPIVLIYHCISFDITEHSSSAKFLS